jgi:hypothetical protein
VKIYRQMIGIVVRHPTLIPAALGLAWRTRSRGWYRRPPFLPLPSRAYLEWRMETAYGDKDHRPSPDEVVRYLRWTSRMRHLTRAGRI